MADFVLVPWKTEAMADGRGKIPPQGIYPRCPHGVMIFNHGAPLYCFACRPFGSVQGSGKFKIPAFGDPLSENDALHANAHDPKRYCGVCGSAFRTELESGQIICSDCHAEISPAPKKRRRTLRPHSFTVYAAR